MNADPDVMAHYPRTLTRDESDRVLDRLTAHVDRHGFGELDLDELLAMARPGNLPSLRVMDRLGMRRDPRDDFRHPPPGTEGSLDYVLYRLPRSARP